MQLPLLNWSAIASPLVLVVWATVLLLVDLFITNKRTTAYLALGGLVLAALAPLTAWNGPATTSFEGMVITDNTAILIDWILLIITAITILFSTDYNQRQGIERGEYYTVVLFSTAAMMFMAHGHNLIVLFLALEWLSICLYVLAGFAYPKIRSEEAAMKYLLYGSFAAGFLIYGIALIFGATGTADLQTIGDALRANPEAVTNPLLLAGVGMILIGFGYKVSTGTLPYVDARRVRRIAHAGRRVYVGGNQGRGLCRAHARDPDCSAVGCAASPANGAGGAGCHHDGRRQCAGGRANQHQAYAGIFVDRACWFHPDWPGGG